MFTKKSIRFNFFLLTLFSGMIFLGSFFYQFQNRVSLTEAKTDFILYEIARINEDRRIELLGNSSNPNSDQTLDSFNYQWIHYNEGKALPSDPEFMKSLQETICLYTDLPPSWFEGKKVIDIGAGSGRFTYGFLSLGAHVTSLEASKGGCEQIRKLCHSYDDRLKVLQANILQDKLPGADFDLVFCYGVAHHTGNTYKAIQNACSLAKQNGKVFFMLYGYPEKVNDFKEVISYESLRQELRNKSFDEKINSLQILFPSELVHGYFDAVSPRINDLLRFQEVVEILDKFGIKNTVRTIDKRNIHIIGSKN